MVFAESYAKKENLVFIMEVGSLQNLCFMVRFPAIV